MKYFYLVSASLLLAATGAPALAQLQDGEAPTPEQVAAGEVVANPVEEKEQALRALHAQMAAVRWTRPPAEELLAYIQRIGEEGLDPLDYSADRLQAVLAGGEDAALSFIATDIFLRVSADLALGHARSDGRVDWFASDDDLNSNIQFELMQRAIANNTIRDTLVSLLPTHPQYAELKAVLASTQDQATRDVVRANLDRWRWLPRDLGKRYVIVNVPAYTAALVEDGRVVARHKVIVGKPGTATPQLSAVATGVIFNPWWEVPESISDEVRGKKGYVSVKNGDKVRYRQPPGPSNALGRMKVVMPNDYAIYLHDTPSKSLFKKEVRAFSHGCIRTEDALGFAELLLANPAWDKAAINRAIAAKKTVKAEGAISTPVYIAYFTAAALQDGGGIRSYPDLYGRDAKVVTALNSRSGEVDIASAETP